VVVLARAVNGGRVGVCFCGLVRAGGYADVVLSVAGMEEFARDLFTVLENDLGKDGEELKRLQASVESSQENLENAVAQVDMAKNGVEVLRQDMQNLQKWKGSIESLFERIDAMEELVSRVELDLDQKEKLVAEKEQQMFGKEGTSWLDKLALPMGLPEKDAKP